MCVLDAHSQQKHPNEGLKKDGSRDQLGEGHVMYSLLAGPLRGKVSVVHSAPVPRSHPFSEFVPARKTEWTHYPRVLTGAWATGMSRCVAKTRGHKGRPTESLPGLDWNSCSLGNLNRRPWSRSNTSNRSPRCCRYR